MKFRGEAEIQHPVAAILHLDEFEAKDHWDAQIKGLRMIRNKYREVEPEDVRLLIFEAKPPEPVKVEKVGTGMMSLF